jgi:hypothetical protein
MQFIAALYNQEVLISRAQHSLEKSKDGLAFIDGGQNGEYIRYGGPVEIIRVEIPYTFAEMYEDWNLRRDKLCNFTVDDVKIIPKEEWGDRETKEFKVKSLFWGTQGKNGDEPLKYKHLTELDTDHLRALLELNYIDEEIKEAINYILKQKNEKITNRKFK